MTCLVYGRTYQLDCTRTEAPFLRDEPLPRRLETAGRCLLRVHWPLAAGRVRDVAEDRDAARVAPRIVRRAALLPGIGLAGDVARRFHRTRHGRHRIRRPARRQPRRVFVESARQRHHERHARPARRELVSVAPQAQRHAPHVHERVRARRRSRIGQSASAACALAAGAALPSFATPLRLDPLRRVPAQVVVRRRPARAHERTARKAGIRARPGMDPRARPGIEGRLRLLGVRYSRGAAPDVGPRPALGNRRVDARNRARERLPARALRGRGGILPTRLRWRGQARLGRAPGVDHGGLRAREPAPELVSGRFELPGRAPPVSAHLPPALPGAVLDRRRDLPGALHPVSRRAESRRRARRELPLAATDGRPRPRLSLTAARATPRTLAARPALNGWPWCAPETPCARHRPASWSRFYWLLVVPS